MNRPDAPGLLGKVLGMVAGAVLLVLGVMFSAVLLILLVVAGLAAWAYFWWKTRELRRTLRERPSDGHVIEGEAVVVEERAAAERITLPRDRGD